MMGATFSCHDDAQQDHANIIRINPNMVTELAAILKKKKFFFSSQSEEASFQYNKLLFFFFSSTLIPFNSLVLCVKVYSISDDAMSLAQFTHWKKTKLPPKYLKLFEFWNL